MSVDAGAYKKQQVLAHKLNKAKAIVSGDSNQYRMSARHQRNWAKSEAVDPEDRKIRLKKLLAYSDKKRDAGRMAADFARDWDQKHAGTTLHSSYGHGFNIDKFPDGSPGHKAVTAKYKLLGQGLKARAIIQKHTGIDHRADGALDWSGGGKLASRPTLKNKAAAYIQLRMMRQNKSGSGLSLKTATSKARKWITRHKLASPRPKVGG